MKPVLNDAKRQQIYVILTVGGTRRMAADYVGCHVKTIRNTEKRDPDFAQRVHRAELAPEITFLKSIQTAAGDSKQWRASAWALERLYPARYALRKPDAVTPQQVIELLDELMTALIEDVPVKRYRQRLWQRLNNIIGKLNSANPNNPHVHSPKS